MGGYISVLCKNYDIPVYNECVMGQPVAPYAVRMLVFLVQSRVTTITFGITSCYCVYFVKCIIVIRSPCFFISAILSVSLFSQYYCYYITSYLY